MKTGNYQKFKPYIFISLAGLFLLLEMSLQVSLSVITPELITDFNITAAGIGIIGSFYFYSYTVMQIPCGILLDCFSSKKIIGISLLLCTLGTAFFAISDSIYLASVGRMLIGFGSAFAFVSVLYIGEQWFPHKYFALIAGLSMVMASLGAIGGEAPLAFLISHIGWRYALLLLSFIGLILAILVFIFVEDKSKKEALSKVQLTTILKEIIIILKKKQTWAFIIFAFAIWSPITGFASLWGVPFLQKAYSITTAQAAFSCSMIWIGVAAGSLLFAWASEKLKSRTLPLRFGALLGVICSIIVIYFHPEIYLLYFLLFVFGVATGGQSLIFAVISDVTDEALIGSSFGIINMAVVASGFIFQPFIGILLKYQHTIAKTHTVAYCTLDYKWALIVIPLAFLVSLAVSLFFIKETYSTSQ